MASYTDHSPTSDYLKAQYNNDNAVFWATKHDYAFTHDY